MNADIAVTVASRPGYTRGWDHVGMNSNGAARGRYRRWWKASWRGQWGMVSWTETRDSPASPGASNTGWDPVGAIEFSPSRFSSWILGSPDPISAPPSRASAQPSLLTVLHGERAADELRVDDPSSSGDRRDRAPRLARGCKTSIAQTRSSFSPSQRGHVVRA